MNTITIDQAIALGHEAIAHGDLRRAKDIFEQVRKQQPDNGKAHEGQGDVARQSGNHGVAAALYIEALHNGGSHNTLFKLGLTMLALQAWWDARTCFAWLQEKEFAAPEGGSETLASAMAKASAACQQMYREQYGVTPDQDFTPTSTEFRYQGEVLSATAAAQVIENAAKNAGATGNPQFAALNRQFLAVYPLNLNARINAAMMHAFAREFAEAYHHFYFARWHWPASAVLLAAFSDLQCQFGRARFTVVAAQLATLFGPDLFTAWSCLGRTLCEAGNRLDSAEKAFRRALELRPGEWSVLNNLNSVLQRKGKLAESIPVYRAIMQSQGDNALVWNNYLLALQYATGFSADEVAAEHLRFGEQFEPRFRSQWGNYRNTRNPDRPLRVGFLSPDFRNHSVAYFVEPLWAALPKDEIQIMAYYCLATVDMVTERLKSYCHGWRDVSGMEDEQLAAQIRADEIDILVDLAGHTGRNRLLVFARKPAPVQVTWLGHPNTTGLRAMDWRLTDATGDPTGVEHRYSEKLWRLPDVFVAYRPMIKAPQLLHSKQYAVKPTPALQNGYVTFGCCNNLAKLTPPVLALWSRLLQELPGAKLLIEAPGLQQAPFRAELLERFTVHGVDASRIIAVGRDFKKQYLRYHEIDIALDPFPCNGGTTTCDLLWMGVPLITMAGDGFMSRMGATLVSAAGHPEWVVANAEDYLARAKALASDIAALNRHRLQARAEIECSPLLDEPRFARHVADAFRAMWTLWCRNDELASPEPNPGKSPERGGALLIEARQALTQRKLGQARRLFDQLIESQPENAAAQEGLGDVATAAGQPNAAAEYYLSALRKKAGSTALYKLGLAMQAVSGVWEARTCFHHLLQRPAAEADTDRLEVQASYDTVSAKCSAIYQQTYGVLPQEDFPAIRQTLFYRRAKLTALQGEQRMARLMRKEGESGSAEAIEFAERMLATFPTNLPVRLDLAGQYLFVRNYSAAQHHLLYLLWHHPANPDVLVTYVNFRSIIGKSASAVVFAELATLFAPQLYTAWAGLGRILQEGANRLDRAEQAFRRALELQPGDSRILNNLASVLMGAGRQTEAIPMYQEVLRKQANNPELWSNYLLALQYAPGFSTEDVAAEHHRFGECFEPLLRGQWGGWKNSPDPARKLRVGFVSPDLRNHSVAYFVEPLWAAFVHEEIDVVAYSNAVTKDPVTQRLNQHCSQWHDVLSWNDDKLAAQIREDGIDILVDLAGHTAGNRLAVFARKPAPVQVTWLGHPNTTGLKAMDWRLTDALGDPQGVETRYTEKLWRLPDAFVVYRPLIKYPELQNSEQYAVQPTPAVKNQYVTFGTCNNLAKLTPEVIRLWSQLLTALPTAKLLIEAPGLSQEATWDQLLGRFTSLGVASEQLLALERDGTRQYLRYNEIDIALDPFPCNGGTTTCDLLWMGVPLVTLAGEGFMSRMGLTLATAAGHPEWVVKDEASYLAKAMELASDIEALNRHRLQARAEIEASPLRDEARFGRYVAEALRDMWRQWCARQKE
ncbi:MAG: tetratricopeptide repeat protein [Pseudomonadales bacterium]|nr:tetratricopeptide repeat protein [Pseudomonadales bacterium]